jgi:hypothetical protein
MLEIEKRDKFDEKPSQITCTNDQNPSISKFAQKLLSEFALNTSRPAPFNKGDERSIYLEILAPMLRYFSIFTQKLAFSWSERTMLHTSSIWITYSDYKKVGVNRKLLGSIGVLK